MARSCVRGSSQYLTYGTRPVTAYPLTMGLRCKFPATPSGTNRVMTIGSFSFPSGGGFLSMYISPTVFALQGNDGTGAVDNYVWQTVTPDNTWRSWIVVIPSSDPATWLLYLNGALGTQETAFAGGNLTFPSGGGIAFAASPSASEPCTVDMADAFILNIAATAGQVSGLVSHSPQLVVPHAVVSEWRFWNGDGDRDWWGKRHLTANNSPTYAQHPGGFVYPGGAC